MIRTACNALGTRLKGTTYELDPNLLGTGCELGMNGARLLSRVFNSWRRARFA